MNFAIGDSVFVIGTLDQFNGLTELVPLAADSAHFGYLKHNAARPSPKHLGLHSFARNAGYAESYEGQLVELDTLYKARGTWPASGSSGSVYLANAAQSDTAQLFVNKNTDVAGWTEPVYPINVVGVVSQYGTDSTGYEIIPRDTTDIVHVIVLGVREKLSDIPKDFYLHQNYPNPFNPSTTIEYGLPKDASVQISVYNILGQRVALLVDGDLKAGNHQVVFNANRFSSGMYLYVMRAGDRVFKEKMLVLK
ncbi:MAG TPA: T9SS type A sorting domain-containing protein [Candidatus Kryptonia bacterium]